MCRAEPHDHAEPFACFTCRKVFRQASRWRLPPDRRPAPGEPRRVPCPQCAQPMADAGPFFKAPKSKDEKSWRRLAEAFRRGFNFYECTCCGPDLSWELADRIGTYLAGRAGGADAAEVLEALSRHIRDRHL